MRVKIKTEYGVLEGMLTQDRNPRTVKEIVKNLPVEGEVNRWGEEIYFTVSFRCAEEVSQQEVELGDIAYWTVGNALCIFFGKTPVSTGEKPMAYSPVNVVGKVTRGIELLKKMRDGDWIKIERWEE